MGQKDRKEKGRLIGGWESNKGRTVGQQVNQQTDCQKQEAAKDAHAHNAKGIAQRSLRQLGAWRQPLVNERSVYALNNYFFFFLIRFGHAEYYLCCAPTATHCTSGVQHQKIAPI